MCPPKKVGRNKINSQYKCCKNFTLREFYFLYGLCGQCNKPFKGSGCGSVGRAVASDTRGPRLESSHRQKNIFIKHLFTVNCVLKRQNKEKRPRMAHLKNQFQEVMLKISV